LRKSSSGDTLLGEAGVVSPLSLNHTFFSKVRYFLSEQEGRRNETWDGAIGLAYRPIYFNRLNFLSKLEYKQSQDATDSSYLTHYALIGSLQGVYSLNNRCQLRGRYAGKFFQEKEELLNEMNNLIQLASMAVTYNLTERWDGSMGYQITWNNSCSNYGQGYFAEIGYRLSHDWWLTAGYSFNGFVDKDISGNNYSGQGPYIKLRFKFDESFLP